MEHLIGSFELLFKEAKLSLHLIGTLDLVDKVTLKGSDVRVELWGEDNGDSILHTSRNWMSPSSPKASTVS